VPIAQPEPADALARELLAERGLQLFHNPSASPCTDSRHGIGYVCRDAELVKLTDVVQEPLSTAVVAAGMLLVLRRLLRRKVTAMLKVHTLRPERPLSIPR
jgi:hypothetical protein